MDQATLDQLNALPLTNPLFTAANQAALAIQPALAPGAMTPPGQLFGGISNTNLLLLAGGVLLVGFLATR